MKFGLLEIGSTNTKAYIYDGENLVSYGSKYIPFKSHYKEHHKILEHDQKELYAFAKDIKKKVAKVYAFATSGFRIMSEENQKNIKDSMRHELDIELKIVSEDEERDYTVKGAISNIDYQKKMAVVIGGGGSTEIAIIENKEIIDKLNLPFGAMDITDHFPELKEDIVETPFESLFQYAKKLIPKINHQVDALVLAGGDYLYYYETVGYQMEHNFLYEDKNQPYLIEIKTSNEYDRDILKRSLNDIKKKCPGNEDWWIGARGMRFCINTIAEELNAKYIIPTRINMLIGISEEIKKITN